METTDLLQKIKIAIDSRDIALARELLKQGLREPNADIYFQASRVAVDATQKKRFLEKGLELDPFHEETVVELSKLSQPSNPPSTSTSIPSTQPPARQQKATTSNKPFAVLAIFGSVVVGVLVLIGISMSSSRSSSTTHYQSPTRIPYPTLTPTPTVQTYNITLERDVTTTIRLYPGDEVSVKASGQIVTGMMGFVATPNGVDESAEFWLSSYSVDSNFRHASLLYSMDTSNQLSFCGTSCEFTVLGNGGGYLQFLINDSKQGDNSGSFKLVVTIISH